MMMERCLSSGSSSGCSQDRFGQCRSDSPPRLRHPALISSSSNRTRSGQDKKRRLSNSSLPALHLPPPSSSSFNHPTLAPLLHAQHSSRPPPPLSPLCFPSLSSFSLSSSCSTPTSSTTSSSFFPPSSSGTTRSRDPSPFSVTSSSAASIKSPPEEDDVVIPPAPAVQGTGEDAKEASRSKRAEQNRTAQRAFRARKEQKMKGLESKVDELEQVLTSRQFESERKLADAFQMIQDLRLENARLHGELSRARGCTTPTGNVKREALDA